MIATKKGEKAPDRTPSGFLEAEPYQPHKLYGPFKVNVGRHVQTDPGETRMHPVTMAYAETLRDRTSEPFFSDTNLAAPQSEGGFGEKFSYVGGNQSGEADPTARMPGESLADFAARIALLAEAEKTGAGAASPSVQIAVKPGATTASGPSDEELKALDGMTPDEVRGFATKYGVDLAALPKGVKRDDLVKHVRQVVREMTGRV